MDGQVYQHFDECSDQRKFNTTTEMLGKYVNKQIEFAVNLMPVYKHIKEPTVPRPAEVREEKGALKVSVYAQQIKQYCD